MFELVYKDSTLFNRLGVGGKFGYLATYVLVYTDQVQVPVLPHPFSER